MKRKNIILYQSDGLITGDVRFKPNGTNPELSRSYFQYILLGEPTVLEIIRSIHKLIGKPFYLLV